MKKDVVKPKPLLYLCINQSFENSSFIIYHSSFPKQSHYPMPTKNNIDWDFILENMQNDKTILCLGSELFSTASGKLNTYLRQAIGESPDVRYYEDGLFNFKGTSDLTAHLRIKRFYNQPLPEVAAILEKIAEMQFSTIISLNPDSQLHKAFDNQNFAYKPAYHHPKTTAEDLAKPTLDNPLIYNLLGSVDVRESMVLTHEDLFEFLESAVEGKSIPTALKGKVKAAYNFIFIGLPFDKWHTQLLMRVLQKDMGKKTFKYATNHARDETVEMFCQDEFNIVCVPTNITEFVDTLHERCKTANLLRGASKALNPYDIWSNQIRKDELTEALDSMLAHFEKENISDSDIINTLINLSGRLNYLDNKISKGNISQENAGIERTQIRDALVRFLSDEVKQA